MDTLVFLPVMEQLIGIERINKFFVISLEIEKILMKTLILKKDF